MTVATTDNPAAAIETQSAARSELIWVFRHGLHQRRMYSELRLDIRLTHPTEQRAEAEAATVALHGLVELIGNSGNGVCLWSKIGL
jgi:hypothetical protein